MAYGALWQLGLAPGSRVTLPPPVALERATPGARGIAATPAPAGLGAPAATVPPTVPLPTAQPTAPLATVVPLAARPTVTPPTSAPRVETPVPTVLPKALIAADAADRTQKRPEAGYAVRLAIPAIKLDTQVAQGGIVEDAQGNPEWQTLPFVAVHYGDLTSLIGAQGNAVIAGHVVTLAEGNVFRFLYQLDIDDQINVWDQHDHEHDFRVVDVKLVVPEDTSVMAPTRDETLTLITCGGTFDPVKREFSDRLIVVAKPL